MPTHGLLLVLCVWVFSDFDDELLPKPLNGLILRFQKKADITSGSYSQSTQRSPEGGSQKY